MVPIASMEQHGPHLPLATDTIQADEITRRAAERAQVLYTPCVWFGYSPQHMYEPGRAARGRSPSARRSCSRSTTTSLVRSSTTASTAWCSSTTTARTSRSSTRSCGGSATRPVRSSLSPSSTPSATWGSISDVMENPPEETPGWHSSELETAQVLAYDEELVRMDRAVNQQVKKPDWFPDSFIKLDGAPEVEFQGYQYFLFPTDHCRLHAERRHRESVPGDRGEGGEDVRALRRAPGCCARGVPEGSGRGAHAGMAGPSVIDGVMTEQPGIALIGTLDTKGGRDRLRARPAGRARREAGRDRLRHPRRAWHRGRRRTGRGRPRGRLRPRAGAGGGKPRRGGRADDRGRTRGLPSALARGADQRGAVPRRRRGRTARRGRNARPTRRRAQADRLPQRVGPPRVRPLRRRERRPRHAFGDRHPRPQSDRALGVRQRRRGCRRVWRATRAGR